MTNNTTEAVRTKNPRLLGSSLADFMREVGLNPETGGGKRSDAKRLHEQCLRLFSARISFVGDMVDGERTGKDRRTLEVTDHQVLWWDKKSPGQSILWLRYVDLTPKFFAAIHCGTDPGGYPGVADFETQSTGPRSVCPELL
jgi:hypothetical protein